MAEPPGWYRYLMDGGLVVQGDLGALATQTLPGPGESVGRHRRPQKTAGQQCLSGPAAGVSKAMDGVEHLAAEMAGNQHTRVSQGKVTQNSLGPDLPNLELGVRGQSLG